MTARQQQHTPEPWQYTVGNNHLYLRDGNGNMIAMTLDVHTDGLLANFRRIVACVNACAGLTDDELGRFIDVRDGLKAAHGRALFQRDALAAALRLVQRGFKMGAVKAAPLLADDPNAETLELISLESCVDAALSQLSQEAP